MKETISSTLIRVRTVFRWQYIRPSLLCHGTPQIHGALQRGQTHMQEVLTNLHVLQGKLAH
eukprot:214887-Amphidinium_carterae.1